MEIGKESSEDGRSEECCSVFGVGEVRSVICLFLFRLLNLEGACNVLGHFGNKIFTLDSTYLLMISFFAT